MLSLFLALVKGLLLAPWPDLMPLPDYVINEDYDQPSLLAILAFARGGIPVIKMHKYLKNLYCTPMARASIAQACLVDEQYGLVDKSTSLSS